MEISQSMHVKKYIVFITHHIQIKYSHKYSHGTNPNM